MAKRRKTKAYVPELDADGNNLKSRSQDMDFRWYKYSGDELHSRLMGNMRRLRDRQRPRREMFRFYAELYGINEVTGLGLTNYDPGGIGYVAPTLPFNVVRRACKTVLAKVAKNRPLPMILTTRGDYKQSKRARGLSDFLAGAFGALHVYDETKTYLRDALVFGTGIGHVYHCPGDKLPRMDRILPWEILTDVADARYGKPLQMFIIRWMDRTVLKELYPKFANEIEMCKSDSGLIEDMPDHDFDADTVLVTFAWRLPTRDGGQPGKFAVAIDGATLEEQPWEKMRFPFVFIKYDDPLMGFWGDSLAGECSGFQYEVNYVVETLRMAHRNVATGIWITDDNAGIPDAWFQNEVGMIWKKRPGTNVQYFNPEPAHAQTYQWLDTNAKGALEWTGISTMAANATKPAGITAAKALQTLDDIESDGFALLERAWEQLHMDIADHLIDEFQMLATETNEELQIFATNKRSLLAIKWKDVNMERDAIVMQVWPVSLLGRTPAARLQTVNDLFNAGIIDATRYLQLLDAPDIDAETDLRIAKRLRCDEQIDFMLDVAEDKATDPESYKMPGPFQDLTYGRARAQDQICMGEMRGVPSPVLDLLRHYIDDCTNLLGDGASQPGANENGQAAPAPGQGGPPQLPPGGAPPPGQPMASIGAPPPTVAPQAPMPGQGTAA
jgi:hypothetical protein